MLFLRKMLVKFWLLITILLAIIATIAGHVAIARVFGGERAYEGQFPYQVSVRHLDTHFCGGSIISRNFVLTAAHCVGEWKQGDFYQYPAKQYTIRAGSTDRFTGGVLIAVDWIKTHEQYANYLFDVALLRLKVALIYSQNIQPIPLATRAIPVGTPVNITGWGYTLSNVGEMPRFLQWNTLNTISRNECKEKINMDSETLLCLGHAADNGACDGDSGGPAVWNDEVVGIANFVYFACGTLYPDVFANVYYHVEWIRKNSDI